MSFAAQFIKLAFDDDEFPRLRRAKFSKEFDVPGQPRKYRVKYHPERRRWSCNCQDWQLRRQYVPDNAPAIDKNCKHVKAHLRGLKAGEVRSNELEAGYRFPTSKYFPKEPKAG